MSLPLSRRTFLLGAAALPLAACAGPAGGGGEALRVAFASGGAKETLDPHVLPLYVDQARAKACFDTLAGWSQQMTAEPRLAESWEPDATGKRWRIRLRRTAFHDGRPLTAADVLYSFRRIADPATTGIAAALFRGVDFAASRAVSGTELEIVLGAPNFLFPLSWGAPGAEIVPQGTTSFANPIGTGPFRFVSFTPGGPARYAANDAYWGGKPPSPELEFVPIQDEEARLGALLSGQVAYAHDLRAPSAVRLERDSRTRVLSAPSAATQSLALRVDRPPFTDPRLREAVRLGLDREALVRIVLLGRGQVGNDMFGRDLQYYPSQIPQVGRDVARAQDLVRQAGAQGLAVELQSSGADPTFDPATAVITQQLAEIGLRVTPRTLPSDGYFKQIQKVGVFSQTSTGTLPIPDYIGRRIVSSATSYRFTGFTSPEIDRLYAAAVGTPDEAARTAALTRIQELLRSESGGLVWASRDWDVGVAAELSGIDAARPNTAAWARFDTARLG
ncbi:ABC transporter substrate-binding protein [Pseudonocardia endophytica]|uniref:Peptide/nickel transport system substrate-binding protein n=1 Tax=Pseudonocardia endophytica TaxID=401976 RepID=A0A4R1HKE3_PSEEN|nr:ABC transporter substrate-binding protein [Pseudonocardia endophytica]TCK22847.1 peptide/nickel transport system substrate-binding protein [Pseudonocardia endophytica]